MVRLSLETSRRGIRTKACSKRCMKDRCLARAKPPGLTRAHQQPEVRDQKPDSTSPRSGRLIVAHRFIGGIKPEYKSVVREADG